MRMTELCCCSRIWPRRIGRLPITLADRCIVFRMQRKTADEPCQRLRSIDTATLQRQCARFVQAKGYLQEDLQEIARRYITKSELQALTQE